MDSLSRSKFAEGRWVSLRTVTLMRMLLGFYCNISCNRILSFLARLYCISLETVATSMLYIGCSKYEVEMFYFLPLCLEYNLNGLVSILTGENHLINFYKKIEQIDCQMGLEHQPFITKRCQVLFLLCCCYRIVLLVLVSSVIWDQFFFFFASFVMSSSIMIGNMSRCFPIELLRARVKHLWCDLEMDLKRENWLEHNQTKSVLESLKLYRSFTNKLMVMPLEKFLICVNFMSTFFFVLGNSRSIIYNITRNFVNTLIIKIAAVDALVTIAVTCLPAILCELVAKEVDRLKIVIGNALLVRDDDDFHAVVRRAADYLDRHPFRATVCRAFALDAPLVLSFVSLCTTYVIFVIQYFDIL